MFFQTMFQTMRPGVDYNLTLSRTENRLTVLVMPKVNDLKDTAQHNLVPFTLTGTAGEIDRGFFPALHQPVTRAAGLLTNMAEYEKQADKAAAASKAAKDEKGKSDREAKEKKDAGTKKTDMGTLFENAPAQPVQPAAVPVAPVASVQEPPRTMAFPAEQPAPVQLPQTAAPVPTQPMAGFGMFAPQPPAQPAAQQPQPVYPGYPPVPHYPQPAAASASPGYAAGDPVYNPADYADIPDVHLTHVGKAMSHSFSAL
jgi:PRTRC genetic system protein E